LLDELDDRIEGIVGVVEQDIAFLDGSEDAGRGLEGQQLGWRKRGELEIRPVHEVGKVHHAHEVERTAELEHPFVVELEMLAEEMKDRLGRIGLDFETHGRAAPKVAQLLLDLLEQVFRLFVVDVEIAVPGNSEGMGADDAVTGKKVPGAQFDDFAEEDESLRAAFVRRDLHEPGQNARHGQDRGEVLGLGRVRIVDRNDDVKGLVGDLRKGVGLVDGQRGQRRMDLLGEVVLGPGALCGGELGGGLESDLLFRERGDEQVVPAVILLVYQFADFREGPLQLLARRQAIDAGFAASGVLLLQEAGDADLEEFIEVGADDGEELGAFEQRVGLVLGLLQHAAIKSQPAQLAVGIDDLAAPGLGRDGLAGLGGDLGGTWFGALGGRHGGGGREWLCRCQRANEAEPGP